MRTIFLGGSILRAPKDLMMTSLYEPLAKFSKFMRLPRLLRGPKKFILMIIIEGYYSFDPLFFSSLILNKGKS
jgi:hypothetical protein